MSCNSKSRPCSSCNTNSTTAKHFIHDPSHLVTTALLSIPHTNPSVQCDIANKIIYRKNGASQVSIVSGGGSGHEPSFASFVGAGLLSGAVAGTIFASPSAEQVRRCILHRVQKDKGVLVVVMNYTGDVLNFGMAVEKARAQGVEVDMVVVGDDAGVGRVVHKIAGAVAAKGYVNLLISARRGGLLTHVAGRA
jgi:dihydroxyacetone kinase